MHFDQRRLSIYREANSRQCTVEGRDPGSAAEQAIDQAPQGYRADWGDTEYTASRQLNSLPLTIFLIFMLLLLYANFRVPLRRA